MKQSIFWWAMVGLSACVLLVGLVWLWQDERCRELAIGLPICLGTVFLMMVRKK